MNSYHVLQLNVSAFSPRGQTKLLKLVGDELTRTRRLRKNPADDTVSNRRAESELIDSFIAIRKFIA